jgi:hypothetical protein
MKFHFVYIGKPTVSLDTMRTEPDPNQLNELYGVINAAIAYPSRVASGDLVINFWCEERYKDNFAELIAKTGLPIRIRAIEELWDAGCTPAHAAHEGIAFLRAHFHTLVNQLMATETIRGRVSVKVIISFLLLYFEGGWFFDNNVSVKHELCEPSIFQVVKSLEQSESSYIAASFLAMSLAPRYGEDNDAILTNYEYISCMKELALGQPTSLLLLGYDKNRWPEIKVAPIELPKGTFPDIWQMCSSQYHQDIYRVLYVYCVVYPSVIKDAKIYTRDSRYHSFCYTRIGAIGLEVIHAALIYKQDMLKPETIAKTMADHFIPEAQRGDKTFNGSHFFDKARPHERECFLGYIRDYRTVATAAEQVGGAAVPSTAHRARVLPESTCPVCTKPATKRCTRCKKVYYCSAVCQTVHWPTHKLSCKK